MTTQFKHQYSNGVHVEMSESEVLNTVRDYDELQTWGYFGNPTMDTDLNFYYVVLEKKLGLPSNAVIGNNAVDYKELSSVAQSNDKSWFCCEFFCSIDEFKKTNYRGTFKIEICRENMPILEPIVIKRKLLILDKEPPTIITNDMTKILPFFLENPGFILPLRDISGLALNEDYVTLLNNKERR